MMHFPIFLDLRGRRVLVLGHGEVAERKAIPLRAAGAEVVMADAFAPALLDGCALAVGADAPEPELRALFAAATAAGIPVNTVDRPELCSFITPAVVDRAPVMVAVSSGGAAPVLARLVRARIEALLPPTLGRLASVVDGLKSRMRAALPDLPRRRRLLEALLTGPEAELVHAGQEDAAQRAMLAAIDAAAGEMPPGIVHLVGAGPGAADLVTLRAQRLLGEADVVVHDRLVSGDVLDLARRDAERIFVGKARANHCLPQEGINALLIKLGREGKRVVRLKGGDPFVFGRGGEEAEALAAAGVAHTVVPGVTAALACAAQAGIALTHRDASRMLTMVTGHTKDGKLDLDFAHLASGGGTIAVYMGIVSLPQLAEGLLAHGLPPDTPAALVERGGTELQRELRGTLPTLARDAPEWTDGGPTLVLVGAVVGRKALLRDPAAVDRERAPGDGGGRVGAQEHREPADLLGG